MKAQWIILVAGLAILVVVGIVIVLARKGPDPGAYLPLGEPMISKRPPERVLEVKFSGPADKVVKEAYSTLFKAYFGLKGSPRDKDMKYPKARYDVSAFGENEAKLKARNWKGSVAIPIPDDVEAPVQPPGTGGMAASAATWEYGDVAEILHLGSYETERPSIERLHDFIAKSGYKAIGDHEEEYLKGPGAWFVLPKDYRTIIRCRVVKAE